METRKVLDTDLLIDGETCLTTIFNILDYPKAMEREEMEVLWPTNEDYLTAIDVTIALLQSGTPIPAVDVLISAMCLNRDLSLSTRDGLFRYVKAVRNDFSFEIRER